jgi:hypothetical protein
MALEQQVAALEDNPAGKIRPKLILRLVLLPIPTIAQKSTFWKFDSEKIEEDGK